MSANGDAPKRAKLVLASLIRSVRLITTPGRSRWHKRRPRLRHRQPAHRLEVHRQLHRRRSDLRLDERAERCPPLDAARAALGERAWQKAWAEGAELDFDAALGLALDLDPAILAAAE